MGDWYLQVTDCTGGPGGTYDAKVLGGAGWPEEEQARAEFHSVPAAKRKTYIMLDLVDNDLDIIDDKHITKAVARKLLGIKL